MNVQFVWGLGSIGQDACVVTVTADTALRLAKYFKMSPEFWLGLQSDYELDVETDRLGDRLDREVGKYSSAS